MKSITWEILAWIVLVAWPGLSLADSLTLNQALSRALTANPEIAAQAEHAAGEHGAIRASYSLDNPQFGLMHENNMNLMELQMGPMNTWNVSQEIKFPTKYFLKGSAQRSMAKAADQELSAKKLEIRQRLISAYYNLFAIDRVTALLDAQRETLREVARSAESRHAVGAVPQQDEMKAHTEQTQIEANLISAQEEQSVAEASLNELMNQNANAPIELSKEELPVPQLKVDPSEIAKLAERDSTRIKAAQDRADAADAGKNLAGWNYAPDFVFNYARAYGNAPPDAYSVGVGISIPLWFFAKQSGEYEAAAAQAGLADRNLDNARLTTVADIKSIASQVLAQNQLLQIYRTSLIPQATTTLSSSRGAYQAGRTTFFELLDSERSLYAVRIAYYRTLSQYVANLAKLEEVAGASLSSLPMGSTL